MTEATENSSLPLLLSITGAVLVVAVGGWFFLDQEISEPTASQSMRITSAATSTLTSTEDARLENANTNVENESETDFVLVRGLVRRHDGRTSAVLRGQ